VSTVIESIGRAGCCPSIGVPVKIKKIPNRSIVSTSEELFMTASDCLEGGELEALNENCREVLKKLSITAQ
jgi:hypothetical protein